MERDKEKPKREKPKFEIIRGNKWKWIFVDKCTHGKNGYISYRNVITRALFCLAKEDWSKDECNDKFTKFKTAYEGRKSYDDAKFFRVYYYHSSTNSSDTALGALIEDQTEGCYPLMIKFDESNRETAFKHALDDVHGKFDQIWEIVSNKRQKEWTRKIETQLDALYDCS